MKGKLPIQVRKIGKKRESSQIRWAKAGQHGGTGRLGWMEGEVDWGGRSLGQMQGKSSVAGCLGKRDFGADVGWLD
ncbi:hypothetical protein AAC387_Pa06g1338 [Persea americana]